MLKRDELTKVQSCLNKARTHEMLFVLLARDEAAPYAIRQWALRRMEVGKNQRSDDQIQEALLCAKIMEDQRSGLQNDLRRQSEIQQPLKNITLQAARMWTLILNFVQCECSQTSYAELKGSQSMDIPVEFLALCEFAEEMGVKLP